MFFTFHLLASLHLADPQSLPPMQYCDLCEGELYEDGLCACFGGKVLCPACMALSANAFLAHWLCQSGAGEDRP